MSRRTRLSVIVVAALAVLAGLAWAGHAVYVREIRGVPLIDEWACSDGEAPVLADGGPGSYCEREGAQLPAGDSWDPLGNRPLSCERRWGWTEITDGERTACLSEDRALPAGWRVG